MIVVNGSKFNRSLQDLNEAKFLESFFLLLFDSGFSRFNDRKLTMIVKASLAFIYSPTAAHFHAANCLTLCRFSIQVSSSEWVWKFSRS